MKEEISLSEIFVILKRHIVKIIIWSLVGLFFAGLYTFFFLIPQYESTSKIVVNQTQNTGQAITNNDIQTNLNLINTYQSIIKEPIILEEVLESTDSNLTIDELRDKITVQTQDNSLVFAVIITDENPYTASDLANATANSFESKIGGILEVESVTILSQAIPSLDPVSPNKVLNLLIGLFLGLIIGVGIAFLNEFMDKRVKDSKIIEDLGWTNLGSVLEMSISEINETRMTGFIKSVNNGNRRTRRRV